MAQTRQDMGSGNVKKLLLQLMIPAVVAQVVNLLYNIVDRIYIGHIAGIGAAALTGVGLFAPILMLLNAFAMLIGAGGAPRTAIALGQGNKEEAEKIIGNSFTMLLFFAVVLTIGFYAGAPFLLRLFGASEATLPYALAYSRIYILGSVCVLLVMGMNPFITTQGFSTYSMATVVIGAVTNIVLDPIFIFGFGMGVKGAALATILAQGVSALWVLSFLRGRRTRLRLQARCLRLRWSILAPVVAIGVSPFIMQSTESLVNIALNSSLKHYGGDLYVGAMTIASSIMQVLWMPFQGLAQGAQPIIGYNYGAGSLDRVKRCFSLMLRFSLLLSVAGWAAVELFPGVFVALFNNKPELVALTVRVLRIYMAGFFMMGLQSACQQTFVALGQARVSLFLALLRKVILLIPLIYLLPLLLTGNQVFAVYLAEPAADLLAATATGLVFLRRFPRILEARRKQLGA